MTRTEFNALALPDGPGVYQFLDSEKRILYVGKAASLHDRVRSYFSKDLVEARNPAIAGMVAQAKTVAWIETDSVLEALILEANLIKRHQPAYNVADKDNKSFNYLAITKEDFPRVLIIRGRELFGAPLKTGSQKLRAVFGPFPHGGALKEAVKIVRKIFPFRDSICTPCEDQLTTSSRKMSEARMSEGSPRTEAVALLRALFVRGLPSDNLGNRARLDRAVDRVSLGRECRPCFSRQVGLCPGVCIGEISKADYKIRIKHISELFSGNFKGLKRQLAKEMTEAAEAEEFEKAAILRRQCEALEHIRDVSLIKEDREMGISAGGGLRIEAYDAAHTAGQETVAVMTVVHNGEAIKDGYRKFKIRSARNDDVSALKEAVKRRLGHLEWPLPRVFVIDGGKGQVRAIERVLRDAGIAIPVVGVVKSELHRPETIIGDTRITQAHERDILLANAEAHRFAITWHRKRLSKRTF